MVDPATGEGIGPAMSSGRYAAWQIKKCFNENNFCSEFMKNYDKQIHKKYFGNYFCKRKLTALYYKFPFLIDSAIYLGYQLNRLRRN